MIKRYGWKEGLDFGGGIGEETILATELGVNMTFVEVEDSKTLAYAKWRFWKNEVKKPKIVFEDYEFKQDFDFVVAMDVFEHIENPQPIIEAIAKHTKYLFCNPTMVKYNWLYPQHISNYSIEPYFKQIELYLYERR
jgi:2-polyprenyl-3-methyl-5-hydroxy-6-metoxy-1,4-benzoquinol methylase